MKFYNNPIVSLSNSKMILLIKESETRKLKFSPYNDEFHTYRFGERFIFLAFKPKILNPTPNWWMTKKTKMYNQKYTNMLHENYLIIL